MKNDKYHEPIMVREVIEKLHIQKGRKYIDATIGAGGHTLEILKRGGIVLGIDADSEALKIAADRLREFEGMYKLVKGNFSSIDKLAKEAGFEKVNGILADFGVSSPQLTSPTRGFSFQNPKASLDMRLDKENQAVQAKDLLRFLREDQLRSLFSRVLGFPKAKILAKRIVGAREKKAIETVGDFLEIVGNLGKKRSLHPATLAFLALRIAVNSEIENIKAFLPKAYELLKRGGKLLVITFHSLENEAVKAKFPLSEVLTPRPDEISKNPRGRSAKMRILEKKE